MEEKTVFNYEETPMSEEEIPTKSGKIPPISESIKFDSNRKYVEDMLDEYCDQQNFSRKYGALLQKWEKEEKSKKKKNQ